MRLNKWNPKKHKYEPFDSPMKKSVMVTRNMDVLVDCAECGKEIKFGDTYTSRFIHTKIGLGYPVCPDCFAIERKLEAENRT